VELGKRRTRATKTEKEARDEEKEQHEEQLGEVSLFVIQTLQTTNGSRGLLPWL